MSGNHCRAAPFFHRIFSVSPWRDHFFVNMANGTSPRRADRNNPATEPETEADMTNARYFDEDEDALDAGLADSAVQDMARRQFGFSLAVAFALLVAAGLAAVKGVHVEPAQMTAQHRIIRVEAPRMEMAQPILHATPRG
jgi:hypothetical protein